MTHRSFKNHFSVCILLLCIISLSSCKFREKVSLLVHHANIYTVNHSFETVEAMAISDGKIVALGSNDDILKKYEGEETIDEKYEGEETIDAGGKTIFPGFIDAHCHFTGYATDNWKCDLVGTQSWNEIISKLTEYSKTTPMEWIYGQHPWNGFTAVAGIKTIGWLKNTPTIKYWIVFFQTNRCI